MVITEFPDDGRLYNLLGLAFHRESNFSSAIQNFRLAREKQTDSHDGTLNLLITLCDVGLYDAASALFEAHHNEISCPSADPATPQLISQHCELGNSYALLGRYAEAASQFETAFKLANESRQIGYRLARMYVEGGSLDKAEHLLQKMIESFPSDVLAHDLMGLVFLSRKQIGKARETWEKAQKIDPSDKISTGYLSIV